MPTNKTSFIKEREDDDPLKQIRALLVGGVCGLVAVMIGLVSIRDGGMIFIACMAVSLIVLLVHTFSQGVNIRFVDIAVVLGALMGIILSVGALIWLWLMSEYSTMLNGNPLWRG